ncbi:unnamed protein product [Heligmosomoides polygyrus]|uniref:ATP-dependent DNA helicase n=1 Tax=Heligmosomoides polygyrus TaxID=6339 RepID=A0A183GPR5_HELPZ|nr:unnamed protein product [Heligmosomoides polygyrus]
MCEQLKEFFTLCFCLRQRLKGTLQTHIFLFNHYMKPQASICLRNFAVILSSSVTLWKLHKEDFMEDFVLNGDTTDVAEFKAFYDIAERISTLGKNYRAYLNIDIQQLFVGDLQVDVDQYNRIGEGPGGSARRKRILNVAWTGIAAKLLPNGRSVISAFHSLVDHRSPSSGTKRQSKEVKTLRAYGTQALEAVNSLLQDIMQKNEPFGGKIMLLGEDFGQVLPVAEKGSRRDFVEVCPKMSVLWPLFKIHKLTTNGLLNDNDYSHREWLPHIGNVKIPTDESGHIKVPDDLICEGDVAEAIFGEALNGGNSDFWELAILTPRNVDALRMNDYVPDRDKVVFLSEDEAIVEHPSDALNFPTKLLNKITPTGMPPHALNFKVGCIVMVLRNLDVSNFLAVKHALYRRVLVCEHAVGSRKGSQVLIPRIDCYFSQNLPFRLMRRQFPIRLSFAMTINRSQGQSLSKIGVALYDPIFALAHCMLPFLAHEAATELL